MKRILSCARVAAVVFLLAGAGLLFAQGRDRAGAHRGPWRVVISKPIVGLSWTAGTLYREHEYLSAMFNQLESDDLQPVMWQVMTQRAAGLVDEDRMLVLCRPK